MQNTPSFENTEMNISSESTIQCIFHKLIWNNRQIAYILVAVKIKKERRHNKKRQKPFFNENDF